MFGDGYQRIGLIVTAVDVVTADCQSPEQETGSQQRGQPPHRSDHSPDCGPYPLSNVNWNLASLADLGTSNAR